MPLLYGIQCHLDARKLEGIQRKFAALCQNRFFNASGTYEDFLKNLKVHTLYDRGRFFDAFLRNSITLLKQIFDLNLLY
jgi:hypothetical protein